MNQSKFHDIVESFLEFVVLKILAPLAILLFVVLCVALVWAVIRETSDEKKPDEYIRHCASYQTTHGIMPIIAGKVTTVMPTTSKRCTSYEHRVRIGGKVYKISAMELVSELDK